MSEVEAVTNDKALIWIDEARMLYKHLRNWFDRRIERGIFEVVYLPGTTRKYLKRDQVEAYVQAHPEEDGQ
jgi:hypothetical protein